MLGRQQVPWNGKQAHCGLQVTCSQSREQTQPKSKGHSPSQLRPRAPAVSSQRRRPHLLLSELQSRPGGHPATCRTEPGAERSGVRKGLQEVVPKEPRGHVRDTHLFTLSRPGRAVVPCKFGTDALDPRSPPTARSPATGCVSESLGCELAWTGGSSGQGGRTGRGAWFPRPD